MQINVRIRDRNPVHLQRTLVDWTFIPCVPSVGDPIYFGEDVDEGKVFEVHEVSWDFSQVGMPRADVIVK